MRADPLGYPRNPLAVYLLALALFSGLLQLLGVNTARSIEDSLLPVARITWGALLVLGSGASLAGIYWPGTVPTGLLLKRVGMFTLSIASSLYALALVVAFGSTAFAQVGIILGFAWACAVQYRVINRRVAQVVRWTRVDGAGK